MMKRLSELENVLTALFLKARKDGVIERVVFTIMLKGNSEPTDSKIEKICKLNAAINGFAIDSVSVIYDDDGFSRIIVSSYNKETILDYINLLVKKDKVRSNPRQMMSAFNKCLIIADDFNSRFGNGAFCRTEELNSIQKTFELMKD